MSGQCTEIVDHRKGIAATEGNITRNKNASTNRRIFDVWDQVSDEVDEFTDEEGIECLAEICTVIVSNRYEV